MNGIKELIQSIYEQGYLMSLATVDDSGPWVADVIFVADDLNLYWLSEENTRHSQALKTNPKVAATITVSNGEGEPNIGLQIEGIAEKIEGDILKIATKNRLKRGKEVPKSLGEILGPGESWYLLKPTKIEIIYEPKWGFKKQILELN